MRDPEVAANLGRHGLEPAPSTPEQLTGFIRAETAKWRPIIERAGASTN
jgi:tripartite-type tricarboxylate transporter receptor subunit TctC